VAAEAPAEVCIEPSEKVIPLAEPVIKIPPVYKLPLIPAPPETIKVPELFDVEA
jgi:hypothetical protein